MSKASKFSLSIADLDKLDMCVLYKDEIRPVLLELTGGSTKKRLTMRDASSSLKEPISVRQLLVPIARVAQTDAVVKDRLTGFINDCATRALLSFEGECPSDDRPRKSIIATKSFLSGELDEGGWTRAYKEGLAAWAGWFAPKGFYASAEWAALDFSSWHYPRVRGSAWAIWAEWAALTLLAYLGMDYRKRERPDEIDDENAAAHQWAVERLALWLEEDAPDPLPLPDPPPSIRGIDPQSICEAEFVQEYYMQWPTIAAYPTGLREIGRLQLERNAGIEIPEGVTKIGEIDVSDHPVVKLPASLRTVGTVDASYDGYVELPEGVETVESIRLYLDSVVHLPNSIRRVGSINTEVESHIDDVGVDDEDEFWEGIEQQETEGVKDYPFYDSFVSYNGRCFIKARQDLTFE
ncbi:hypothetical protein CP97_14894 (plasmid) [Aurantiacibacter atlanticus]|uniref:Uncharacterized protein n=2 Tax=Aurantiacibacter atlanticus TaxID=1648404 RepID=A0A168M4E2_9SPHN|nr:hypothetical protein CP97_14894 [Aurantiacibacter atlanticus]